MFMMLALPLVWLLLFNARYSSAARSAANTNSENGALVAEIGQQENGFPECFEVAKLTYPGGCNPKKSAFACYSTEKVYRPTQTDPAVKVQWACSKEFDTTDISMDACPAREWHFDGEVDKKHLKFAAPAGIYAGACQFSVLPELQGESPKAATTPEQPSAVATTPEHTVPDATTPSQTATTPENEAKPVLDNFEDGLQSTVRTQIQPRIEHGEETTAATTSKMTPATDQTTMKNGVACNSVGSLLTTALGLAVYHLQ